MPCAEGRGPLRGRPSTVTLLRVAVAHVNKTKNSFLHYPKQLSNRVAQPRKNCVKFAQHRLLCRSARRARSVGCVLTYHWCGWPHHHCARCCVHLTEKSVHEEQNHNSKPAND